MEDEFVKAPSTRVFSFECESCGHSFETWESLRQHQVDCQNESFESSV
jgi:hypothetical protein